VTAFSLLPPSIGIEQMANNSSLRRVVAENTEINYYTKRDSAQLQLDSIVYPVLTLPSEITSEIFICCLPTSSTDVERNAVDPHAPPMLLSHVCQAWREITLSTPALWATIDLDMDVHGADAFGT
jgi:hypothetical protein